MRVDNVGGAAMIRSVMLCLLLVSLAVALPVSGAQATEALCSEQSSATICDSDDDRITDAVEAVICGSATCATGAEDSDRDGIPDWSEVVVCGGLRCADPAADTDGDGVPDFAERFVCGNQTCATALADADSDQISDWVEFVICGDRSCANGREDYDGSGVADAVELAACVKWSGNSGPASVNPFGVVFFVTPGGVVTQVLWWPLYLAIGLVALAGLALLGWWLVRRRHHSGDTDSDSSVGSDVTTPQA